LNSSAGRAEFARQLYNLRHVLESEEADDATEDMVQQLKDTIEQHVRAHPLDSFHALAVMSAQVKVLKSKMKQTARSSQRAVIRWNREPLWMKREVYG
jgi:uncharacterized protein YyaL (SSP411 family)